MSMHMYGGLTTVDQAPETEVMVCSNTMDYEHNVINTRLLTYSEREKGEGRESERERERERKRETQNESDISRFYKYM